MMMKRFWISLGIAVLLSLLGTGGEYLYWLSNNRLVFSLDMPGGEMLLQIAFGLRALHTYAMTLEQTDSHSLHFSPLGFLAYTLAFTAVIYLILTLVSKLRKQ